MSQRDYAYHGNRQSAALRKRRRRRRRIRQLKRIFLCIIMVAVVCGGIAFFGTREAKGKGQAEEFLQSQRNNQESEYPRELQELLERNTETYDFVVSYPDRAEYRGKAIDLIGEVKEGEVPLFLQWDRRWGYDSYGTEMIGLAGCGPTCMSMAYVYLTGDMDMNPRKMAEFANDNGYYTTAGTSWNFFTEGAGRLGLEAEEIGLDEAVMKSELDAGKVIICSMRPGDFTTTGHIILIRGYNAKGFWVNDPNSRENSEKPWKYDRLSEQIKCLWSVGS